MSHPSFAGCYTAIVTPFTEGGTAIDWAAFERLIEMQIAAGVDGLVFVGTTGESPTISFAEHDEILRRGAAIVAGRTRVIAGTGANATAEVLHFAKIADEIGADAQLIVAPYYNKPTQAGLLAHFRAVADATKTPIILYNIFGRTGVNIATDTVVELAKHPMIVGVKEASGSLPQMMDVIERVPADFTVISGDDDLTLPLIAAGGHGVISVVSNYLPRRVTELVHAAIKGDFKKARELHYALRPVVRASFIETSPVPAKELLALLGLIEMSVRLPLVRVSEGSLATLRDIATTIKTLEPETYVSR